MKLILGFLLLIALSASEVTGQDPLKVAPQAYKLQFENEWVRVIRVHYEPRAKLPVHDHTQWPAAYVYLNDSGEIIFKHIGAEGANPITRPPTKAGAFRLYKAITEVHEVENPTDLPSDFLRVEFKTEVVDEKTLRGRYFREDYPASENYSKVQFEDGQVRITRLANVAGKSLDLASTNEPYLLVALTSNQLQLATGKQVAKPLSLKAGEAKWFGAGHKALIRNSSEHAAEFLRFDFKTRPLKAGPKSVDRH